MPNPGYPIPGNPWARSMAPMAPPAYSPVPMGNGGDPMALAMMMFGMPILQQMAGPGNFLANMAPGQQLADQMLASEYQKTTLAATAHGAEAGNTEVVKRIQGLTTAAFGPGKSPLNAAQMANVAGLVNHPIGKMVLGQMVGPENLEGFMFGRKGDPQALAAASNRIGFFRQDTLGGSGRMTQESLEDFSTSLHANLYGPPPEVAEKLSRDEAHTELMKRADYAKMTQKEQNVELEKALPEYREKFKARANDMHGFMGGQSAQMVDYLFQRGSLPQSIGALSPADRVKAVAEGPRDAETLERLSREYTKRELMRTDADYSKAAPEEQKTILEKNLPTYRSRLENTFKEIDKVRSTDPRTASPGAMEKKLAEVEKLGGYDVAARNTDASRTADKLKQFSGAISAVRQIFGDSGNPNAPMPALLAAMEHLSQGTMHQVGPGKVESTLRQMRTAARDAGIGFEQLAGISAETSAYGDTLGISRPTSMQNTLNAITMTKVMRDSGMFSNPIYGSLDQAGAGREVALRMQRGSASGVNKTMAAIARAVETNPEMYKDKPGSEMLQKMVQAYRSGENKFTVDGKDYNLAEMAGTGGAQELTHRFAQGGGNVETLRALAIDPTTGKYSRESFGFEAQKYQIQRDIARNTIEGEIASKIGSDKFGAVANSLGFADNEQKSFFSKDLSFALAKTIQEETALMSDDDRVKHMEKRAPELIQSLLMEKQGVDATEAARRTNEIMPHIFGSSPAQMRDVMQRITANAGAYASHETNLQLPGLAIYNHADKFLRETTVNKNRAERAAAMAGGSETTMAQRIGEEFARIGETGEFDMRRFLTHGLGNSIDKAAARDKFAPELAAGFASIMDEYAKIAVNEKDVEAAAKAAASSSTPAEKTAAKKELKALAGIDKDVELLDSAQIAEKLKAKDAKEINKLYHERVQGGTASDKDIASQIDALSKTFDAGTISGVLDPDKKQQTVQQAHHAARLRIGSGRGDTPEERERNEKNIRRLQNLSAAAQNADQQLAIEDSARAIADIAVDERKLEGDAAAALRDQYKAAAMGDAKALKDIEAGGLSEEEKRRLPQLKLLHDAGKLVRDEGIVLRDNVVSDKLGAEEEAKAAEEREKEKAREAKKAADPKSTTEKPGDAPADKEKKTKPWWSSWFGNADDKADKAAKPDEKKPAAGAPGTAAADKPGADRETRLTDAKFSAESVELVAAAVNMTDKSAGEGREAEVAAAVQTASAETSKIASAPPSAGGQSGTQEITLNGTLTVRGMREAVISAVGERPLDTPNGTPIMDPHPTNELA